jgi:RHS repeat-associated protein
MSIAELDSTGSVEKRYGPGYIVKNDTTYRVIRDHLGSVRIITNFQTGEIVQQIDYSAFGKITDMQNGNAFLDVAYAGGLYDDDTDFMRFGARDYNPHTGRWTNKDPILFNGRQSNLYVYVNNNPVNFTDPNGKFAWVAAGAVLGAAVNVGATLIANGGDVSWRQIGAAAASGAISGAVGAVAGPLGGTIAKGVLGASTSGLAASVATAGVSAIGSGAGQAVANQIDPCSATNPLNAALYGGLGGGLAKGAFSTKNLNSLSQANDFAPTTFKGLFGSSNAWRNQGAYATSSGVGAASNFPIINPF